MMDVVEPQAEQVDWSPGLNVPRPTESCRNPPQGAGAEQVTLLLVIGSPVAVVPVTKDVIPCRRTRSEGAKVPSAAALPRTNEGGFESETCTVMGESG